MTTEMWKVSAAASVTFSAMALIAWLFVARANLKAELAEARAGFEICRSANADWEEKAKTFNEAVSKLKEEAMRRTENAAEVMASATHKAERHAAQARKIGGVSDQGDNCLAARRLIGKYLTGRGG